MAAELVHSNDYGDSDSNGCGYGETAVVVVAAAPAGYGVAVTDAVAAADDGYNCLISVADVEVVVAIVV